MVLSCSVAKLSIGILTALVVLCCFHLRTPKKKAQQQWRELNRTQREFYRSLYGRVRHNPLIERIMPDVTWCLLGHSRPSVLHYPEWLDIEVNQKDTLIRSMVYQIKDKISTAWVESKALEILLENCNQTKPLSFRQYLEDHPSIERGDKLADGLFAEVFHYTDDDGHKHVWKLLPIGGKAEWRKRDQSGIRHMLQELVMTLTLDRLRSQCDMFTHVYSAMVLRGALPSKLQKRLKDYAKENRRKSYDLSHFPSGQLWFALDMAWSGESLFFSRYLFRDAGEALAVIRQVLLALAVAEDRNQFEHRDLHSGNVLLEPTRRKNISAEVGGHSITVALRGYKVSIVDYTASRVMTNHCVIYKELGKEHPGWFDSYGVDLRGEAYLSIMTETDGFFASFAPKTNIYWSWYLTSRMLNRVNYYEGRLSDPHHPWALTKLRCMFLLMPYLYKSASDIVVQRGKDWDGFEKGPPI